MMSKSRMIAQWVTDLSFDQIPDDVCAKAKQEMLDTIGICLASSSYGLAEPLLRGLETMDHSSACTVIGSSRRLAITNAALINGVLAHAVDYDDTHGAAIVHVSASLLPTALAVAEHVGASGLQLITALVTGYEVAIRVGLAAAGAFHARGFHPTGVCGVFGATVVAGKLLGLTTEQLTDALGIAGSQASGIQQFLQDGSDVKRMHAGWAALGGIYAAMLAQHGLTGPEHVFEGRFGLYQSHIGQTAQEAELTRGLSTEWETMHISIKPYACCHLVHAYMDAASEALLDHDLTPDHIAEIVCHVPETVAHLVCEPAAMKQRPPTPYAALFSLPFCVSVMLCTERAGLDEFSEETIHDDQVLDLARKVTYVIDTEWSDFPQHFSGWVTIHTGDGQVIDRRLRYNRGAPENPLPSSVIEDKYRANASRRLSADCVDRLLSAVEQLEHANVLDDLYAQLHV